MQVPARAKPKRILPSRLTFAHHRNIVLRTQGPINNIQQKMKLKIKSREKNRDKHGLIISLAGNNPC
jgi:hypothetical protein